MAYIDPDGMFGGDRMALLTDKARFFWPWIWVASNTVGRIELNHRKICDTAFRQFRHRPTEEQFWALVKEFQDCYLLFIYKDEIGRIWGQWDVTEKYLPTYKIKADTATPEPLARPWIDWKKKYLDFKARRLFDKSSGLNIFENFENISETFERFSLGEERRDLGEDKPSCANAEAQQPVSAVSSSLMDGPKAKPQKATSGEGFDRWYEVYWRHAARKDALAAFNRRITQLKGTGLTYEQSVEFLIEQAVGDRKRFEPSEEWGWRSKLHPATWLNGERWKDEPASATARVNHRNLTALEQLKAERDEKRRQANA